MIIVDRARCTFQGGLFSLHALVYRLSMLGGRPRRPRPRPPPHPLLLVHLRTYSSRCHRHWLHWLCLSYVGFFWSSVSLHWIPSVCESREGLGLWPNGCWAWVWDPSGDGGRDGRVRRWGREELMMWQFVIVYKHVCKRAGHAGTPKIIKNTIF